TPKAVRTLFFAAIIGFPLYFVALLILLVSGAGEIFAIVMLIEQSDNVLILWFVASSVILLIVVNLVVPLWALSVAMRRFGEAYEGLKSQILASPVYYSTMIIKWYYEWLDAVITRMRPVNVAAKGIAANKKGALSVFLIGSDTALRR